MRAGAGIITHAYIQIAHLTYFSYSNMCLSLASTLMAQTLFELA